VIVVVALGRPERAPIVLAQWRAQTVRASIVLVAEQPVPGAITTPGPRSAGGKRNAGLEYARRHGHEFAVLWDDDNYYGRRYLEDFQSADESGADVASRGLGLVRFGAELFHFPRRIGFFPGHSTGVRVNIAPEFADCSGGEELPWTKRLKDAGASVSWLSPWHLVYDRTPGKHAYQSTRAEFFGSFGTPRELGKRADLFADAPHALDQYPSAPEVTDDEVFAALEARP
jgi:hypothetical protein